MKQYLDVMNDILVNGSLSDDRTGVGTRSVFGRQMRFNLEQGFPLLTTKKVHLRSIIHELLWFISGDSNIGYLKENGVSIWDDWADEDGELGPVYGRQWRDWQGIDADGNEVVIDQLQNVVESLRKNPFSRRHIVSAWNPAQVDAMALPPCHTMFQFHVARPKPGDTDTRYVLSCQLYQRSADWFLGVPFNIASYALLTMMMAQVCGYRVGDFVHTFGDAHLYNNHVEQAVLQLQRTPGKLPIMLLNPKAQSIFSFEYDDFTLVGYEPQPHIAAPIAV